MRSFNFLTERQVPLVFGPGRHPTSSARFLYFEGPDGMVFEYSSGVREIADELGASQATVHRCLKARIKEGMTVSL